MHADWQRQVKVVTLPPEHVVRHHLDRHVEIAVPRPAPSRVPAIGNPQPCAVVDAGRDRHRHPFAAHIQPVARACGTSLHPLLAGALARRATLGEHHVAARPPHVAAALARRAPALRRPYRSGSAARAAHVLANDDNLALDAAHRLIERDRNRGVNVGALLRPAGVSRRNRVQHLREQFRERRRLRTVGRR